MAVIKKISELEQLETLTDSSNIIIEENGVAKRIPASYVGSGSDSVSDEQIAQAVSDYMTENPVEVTDVVKSVNGVAPDENGNVEIDVSGSGVSIELDTTLSVEGKAADAKAVGDAISALSGVGVTQKEVITTVTVGADAVTLDSTAPEQVVNLAWAVDGARTVPAFTNYYLANSKYTYPRTFSTATHTQFWHSTNYHGNADAFVAGHYYFNAMKYSIDGDSSVVLQGWGDFLTPSGTTSLTGSGWAYGLRAPSAATNATDFMIQKNTEETITGTIDYVYCIDITALQEAGVVAEGVTVAELAELFGELPLTPGQDYSGGTIGDGTATLSINRDGEIATVGNTSATAAVKGGDILSVDGGSVTFTCKVLKTVSVDSVGVWEGIKWVAVGDSLTDSTINADKKYHAYIVEATGISVTVLGVGGTGYWRGYADGTSYGQRMVNIPADTDIVTIFGSVNDWQTQNNDVEIGTATDTIESGTLAGYINDAIDVAFEKAPYAQVALITPLDYHGIPDDIMESIANIIVDVAKYRKVKCMDMYHSSGFRVDDPTFAAVYCTDYSETDATYGHPSNLAHEKLIAPEFTELLKRMILTV